MARFGFENVRQHCYTQALMSAVGYVTLFESDVSGAEFVIPHQINI